MRLRLALIGALSPALVASIALAAGTTSPKPGSARLAGRFLMAGTVTKAVLIRGEHVGDKVTRTWTFTPLCANGPCSQVKLNRQRATGTDTLVLKAISRGYYEGNGKFYARLRCAGRLYYRGESVPFTIQVRVTAATVAGGTTFATRIRASYTNRSRRNHTPCIAFPGHDAAKYRGHAVPGTGGPAPDAGRARASDAGV